MPYCIFKVIGYILNGSVNAHHVFKDSCHILRGSVPHHIIKDTCHILSQPVNGTPHFQGYLLCFEWTCAKYLIYKDIGHILNESVTPHIFNIQVMLQIDQYIHTSSRILVKF